MNEEKVLDIWAIQKNPNELYIALDNIKSDVIIFKNCICKFKIGDQVINSRQFDTVIYSEESDTMVMLARGGKATSEMAEKYFDKHNIDYNIVTFKDLPEFKDNENVKEFWFARDPYVLEDAIDDSTKRAEISCKYDSTIKSQLTFKYKLKDDGTEILLKIRFRGLIEFCDKYILPTLSNSQENLTKYTIIDILRHKNIDIEPFDANSDLHI